MTEHLDPTASARAEDFFALAAAAFREEGGVVEETKTPDGTTYTFAVVGDQSLAVLAAMGTSLAWSEFWQSSNRAGVHTFFVPEHLREEKMIQILTPAQVISGAARDVSELFPSSAGEAGAAFLYSRYRATDAPDWDDLDDEAKTPWYWTVNHLASIIATTQAQRDYRDANRTSSGFFDAGK